MADANLVARTKLCQKEIEKSGRKCNAGIERPANGLVDSIRIVTRSGEDHAGDDKENLDDKGAEDERDCGDTIESKVGIALVRRSHRFEHHLP